MEMYFFDVLRPKEGFSHLHISKSSVRGYKNFAERLNIFYYQPRVKYI